jgi:hypothetical protein
MLEIFINEFSLQEQYLTVAEFKEAVIIFNNLIQILQESIQKGSTVYNDRERLVLYSAIKSYNFPKSLNKLQKDVQTDFLDIMYNRNKTINWRTEQVHLTEDKFYYFDTIVTDTTLAEVAERKLQNKNSIYLVINFQNSSFNHPHADIQACCLISVVKNSTIPIEIDGLDNQEGLSHWISLKFPSYGNNSYTPRDNQTILDDKERFRKTSNIFQGRNIYVERETCTYWYIDNLHIGKASHFEVFDKRGKHIGEANLNGDIDISKRDPNKKLKI